MTQYLLLIFSPTLSPIEPEEWDAFFALARESGFFKGGSALGERWRVGASHPISTHDISGYMRFDTEDRAALETLLAQHPVVRHGGTVELCEMPRS